LRTYLALLPLLDSIANSSDATGSIRKALNGLSAPAISGLPAATGSMGSGVYGLMDPASSGLPAYNANRMQPEETSPGGFWWESFELIREAFKALTLLLNNLSPAQDAPTIPTQQTPGSGRGFVWDPNNITKKSS